MELSNVTETDKKPKKSGWIYIVTPAKIVLYIVLTLSLAAAVGLLVYLATSNKAGSCETASADDELAWERCYDMSVSRNECMPCPAIQQNPALQTPLPRITDLRLPKTLVPHHYNVEIKADIYKPDPEDFSFDGSVDIFLECQEPTDLIVVHKHPILTIQHTTIKVQGDSGGEYEIKSTDTDPDRHFYKVTLNKQLQQGMEVVVIIEFKGPLHSSPMGMFWNEYFVDGQARYALFTTLETTDARAVFPCLDEPHLKATFNVTLWRKPWMVALSNMPVEYTKDEGEDDWLSEHYYQTVIMPTYLVAFGISNFTFTDAHSIGGKYPSKHMRFYAPPDVIKDGHGDYIASKEGAMFDYLEDRFDYQFQLPKLDSIAIHIFPLVAMENWGLVTYTGTRMLWDVEYSTEYEKQRLLGTSGHELVHMWLGNVVTCKWWDDLWLQEGMARYYQHFAIKEAEPNWDIDQIWISQVVTGALFADSDGRSHPIHNPTIHTPDELNSMFGAISYGKAGSVIKMVHQLIMGNEDFDASMREYIKKHEYGNAHHDDLLSMLDKHVQPAELPPNRNMTSIIYTWIKQMGFPVINFSRTGNKITLSQKMFLRVPERPIKERYPSEYGYRWDIPVRYFTNNDRTVNLEWFLRDDEDGRGFEISDGADWVLADPGWKTFSRINYDEGTWKDLIAQLNSNHEAISDPVDRARLIDDSMELAAAGLLDHVIALDATKYLLNEDAFTPWYTAERGFSYLANVLYPDAEYGLLREYMRDLVQQKYNSLGWEYVNGEDLMINYLRGKIQSIACNNGNLDCITRATQLFTRWQQSPSDTSIIVPDQRLLVYCTQIKHGLSDSWDFLYEQYMNNWHSGPDGVERTRMLQGLACSREKWILDKFIQMADTGKGVFPPDRKNIMEYVAANLDGKFVLWNYLKTNWETIRFKSSVLTNVADHFSTNIELKELEDFLGNHPPKTVDEEVAFEEAVYAVKAKVSWRQQNEEAVKEWLKKTVKEHTT